MLLCNLGCESLQLPLMHFSRLRSAESKPKLPEASRDKTDITLIDMKTVLQLSEQAHHFAGNSKVILAEEIAYSSKSTVRKPENVETAYYCPQIGTS